MNRATIDSFRAPTEVYYGRGAVARVGDVTTRYAHERLLLISDAGVVAAGLLDRVTDQLRVGIPATLSAVQVPRAGIPALATDAMKSGNIPLNPRPTTYEDMVGLYERCM